MLHIFIIFMCYLVLYLHCLYRTTELHNYIQTDPNTFFTLYHDMSQAGPDAYKSTDWNSNSKSPVLTWKVTEFHWWWVCVLLLVRS